MKRVLLTLVCSIGIISAGVLDNIDEELSGQEGDSNGRSGIQHISQMTHENLMRQKFLFDILKHISEPIANGDHAQISSSAHNQLIGDASQYNEDIDEDMSHVIELIRKGQLLNKNEPFTIANEEHMRQMIGLYRLLVSARDWTTLKEIIEHARAHISDALFVSALLSAIRDREDTQHLILPGIHEILPELYHDEEIIKGVKSLNLKQLNDARTSTKGSTTMGLPTIRSPTTKTVGPHRPSILEMIGMNKLLRNKSSKDLSSDRHELWMPWRDMHKEMQARKEGRSEEEELIVISATREPQGAEEDESGLKLLTEDVGLQAFLQSFMIDLCLSEKEAKQMGRQEKMSQVQKRAGLDRAGWRKNEGSLSKSSMRQPGGENMWNTQKKIDEDYERLLHVGRRRWEETNWDANMNGEQQMKEQQNGAQIGRVGLNGNMDSTIENGIRSRYDGDDNGNIDANNMRLRTMGRRPWSQSNQDHSGAGIRHEGLSHGWMPQRGVGNRFDQHRDENMWRTQNPYSDSHWAEWSPYWTEDNDDDDSGLYNHHGWDDGNSNLQWLQRYSPMNENQRNVFTPRNSMWSSQRGSSINHQLLGGGLPTHTVNEALVNQRRQQAHAINQMYSKLGGKDMDSEDWTHGSLESNKANMRQRFLSAIQHQNRDELRDQKNSDNRYSTNSHWSTGMPMDWNRQMAMHRQKTKMNEDQQRGYKGIMGLQDQRTEKMGHSLRQVDIDDERLLPISRRNLKKLISSEQQESQKQDKLGGQRGTQGSGQRWVHENLMGNEGGNKNWLGSTDNGKVWTTTAGRGISNMGQNVMGQRGLGSMDDKGKWTAENRASQSTHWGDANNNRGHTMMTHQGRQEIHWSDETRTKGRSMMNNPARQNTYWTDESHTKGGSMMNNPGRQETLWNDKTYETGRSMTNNPGRQETHWTDETHTKGRSMINNPTRQNTHWIDETHNTGSAMMNKNTHWADETDNMSPSMKNSPSHHSTLWTDEGHNTDSATMNHANHQNMYWQELDSQDEEATRMGMGIRHRRSLRWSMHWNDLDLEDEEGTRMDIENVRPMRSMRPSTRWNDLDLKEDDETRMSMGNVRQRRALSSLSNSATEDHKTSIGQMRGGELLLHNLQQLMARIHLEQLSHGLYETAAEDIEGNRRVHSLESMSAAETHQDRELSEQINEVEKHLQKVMQNEIEHKIGTTQEGDVREQAKIDEVIGDVLMGKSMEGENEVNILNILRAIMQQTEERGQTSGTQKLSQMSLNINDAAVRHLLRRIVHLADNLRAAQLGAYRKEELQAHGITINEVKVDKLSTFVDTTDVDLINALDASQQRALHTTDGQARRRMVVARQQRLNHKDFTIKIDVNAERAQEVMVRTLLGPKIDSFPKEVTAQLNAQRHNYILLDAHVATLRSGRNQIKRKSRDISWTAADTTPFSVAYRRVMSALNGEHPIGGAHDQLRGQTCRFPHRLLLPRGRAHGLPLQMLVVITPVEDEDQHTQQWSLDQRVCGIGVGSANLDRLPLGFPLDRPIKAASELFSLPNVHLLDVQIYHDKQVKDQDEVHDLSDELW